MQPPVSLSSQSDSREMHITLADLRYLFESPPVAPLAGSHLGQSGLDAVLQRMKRERPARGAPLRLLISAPPWQASAEAATEVQYALAAHCAALIGSVEDDLMLLRREMVQSLKVGGLFLTACLVLATSVDQLTALPALLRDLLRESLIIAGWVGIWHPLDLILYAWWPSRFRIGQLRRLAAAEIELRPA
jgi:hypothetical protein